MVASKQLIRIQKGKRHIVSSRYCVTTQVWKSTLLAEEAREENRKILRNRANCSASLGPAYRFKTPETKLLKIQKTEVLKTTKTIS